MSSVSQIIPTYAVGGISNQPDELKKPGQVIDCLNAFPDLVEGLYKRNGFQSNGIMFDGCNSSVALVDKTASWFTFIRENPVSKSVENFVGRVSDDGKINLYNIDGTEIDVYYSTNTINPNYAEGINLGAISTCVGSDYLKHTQNNFLKFNTINNFTFVTNPSSAVTMNTKGKARPYEAFIEITQLAPGREYLLDVDLIDEDETSKYKTVNTVKLVSVTDFGGGNRDPSCPANFNNPSISIEEENLRDTPARGQTGLVVAIESIGSQTVDGDGDFECTYRHTVEVVNGGRDWETGDKFKYHQSGDPAGVDGEDASYTIEVTDTTTIRSSAEYQVTGVITPSTGDTMLRVKDILDGLKSELEDLPPFGPTDVVIRGNGIYVTSSQPFTISTTEKDLMNILSNEDEDRNNPYITVNNVSRLPIECYDGLVAKVSNSFVNEDDYWVQFRGNYGQSAGSNRATGYWEEVAEPGGNTKFNPGTMPHALVYSRLNGKTVFVFGPIDWNQRTCGTTDFNPSFEGFTINHVSYFRNRLVFLSQENVIMSKAGDLFNFFPGSALAVAPNDPIDISAATDFSSVLQDALVINNGLLIFSNYQQFLFTTDSDILDPTTAKVSEVSRYEYNTLTRPFAIGTNVGFLGTSTVNSRLYELTNVFREGSTDINERSAVIAKSLPADMNLVTQSKETGLIMLGKTGTREIWCYRYFKEGANQQLQSTWFRWEAPGELRYHFIIDNEYYAVLSTAGGLTITKVNLETMAGPWVDFNDQSFEMRVVFPQINLVKTVGESYMADTTSSLVVHRVIFNFADIGTYNIEVQRNGMDTYDVLYESRYMDDYKDSQFPTFPKVERPVPVYTRNEDLDITLKSSYPHPIILRSMRWEGDYNTRFYKRV